jgi:hypothetical protein
MLRQRLRSRAPLIRPDVGARSRFRNGGVQDLDGPAGALDRFDGRP